MGLLTLTQIPCHHVLANEIALNFKYHIGLKHLFNINLGIGIIKKKLLFLFVFSTYLPVFLLKFWQGELLGCRIKFQIQRVPTWHTFDGTRYPKNKKYLKKCDISIDLNFMKTWNIDYVCFWMITISNKYSLLSWGVQIWSFLFGNM